MKKSEPKPEPKPEPKADGPTQLTVPAQPGAEAWVVGRAADATPSAPVVIPAVTPLAMSGLVVRPALNRAVVTCRYLAKKGGPLTTRVVLCDTAAGTILNEWQMAGDYAAIDLSPDGRSILATAPNAGRGRESLRIWLISSGGRIKSWWWEPHTVPVAGPPKTDSGRQMTEYEAVDVRWAAFVGNDRVVSMSWAGQLRVWNPDGPQLLATIDATQCRPAITPDGTRVAFLAGEVVALLDPTAGKINDIRHLGTPPAYPVLAFNPDGTKLAVGGNGKALILDLASGDVLHAPLPKLRVTDNGTYDRSFAWAGNDYLRSDQQLHDANFPLPVWDYRGAEKLVTTGGQTWVSYNTAARYTSTLRALQLPHTDLQAVVARAKKGAAEFVLKPGDRVRIDVAGIPADRRDAVKSAIDARVREIGYAPDDAASATLFASVDVAGIKTNVTYVARKPVEYVRRAAKLQLVHNGKELWSEEWSAPPPLQPQPLPKEPMQKYLERVGAGAPNYELFKIVPIPAYFPSPTAPAQALGASDFTADGIRDAAVSRQ